MKALLLLCAGFFSVLAVAQNSTDSTPAAPTPVIITPGQPPSGTGVGLQELSPPIRPGRRGGVYVTGAPPMPPTNDFSYRIASAITNALYTNEVGATESPAGTNEMGATGGAVATNTGSSASYEMEIPTIPPPPFVPLLRPPRLTPPTPSTTGSNTFLPPLSAPAGTATPAIPPAGTTSPVTPPPGPGANLPGSQIVPPPPPISTPSPITGPQR